jgi:3-polyprenyl-4-hydroxybenzoate decarboxylase
LLECKIGEIFAPIAHISHIGLGIEDSICQCVHINLANGGREQVLVVRETSFHGIALYDISSLLSSLSNVTFIESDSLESGIKLGFS